MKFYRCEVCGKIVAKVRETPVGTVCCGKQEATFSLVPCDKVKNVYEYCNIHGPWKT